jgi:GNAT superfamily N-acetyltransferase
MMSFQKMDEQFVPIAEQILRRFLQEDVHYLASRAVYGDAGDAGLRRALALFIERPELGFVWLGISGGQPIAVCVVCFAISTSTGTLVAKLEDVFVMPEHQGKGIGSKLLSTLSDELRRLGVTRIDTAVHFRNSVAKRFYQRCGFQSLSEERLSRLLDD